MRPVVPVVGVLAVVAGLALIKAKQISTLVHFGKAAEAAGPPPESVGSSIARADTWETTIPATGSVESFKGVALSLEVAGTVSAIRFESGATVKKGDILVELESKVERAQLASANARRQLAAETLARNEKLVATGTLAAAQLDTDQAVMKSATSDIAALEAQIARKTLRAPFDGKLGIRAINLGQYLAAGTLVTDIETPEAQYVDFTLPQARLAEVSVGTPVRFTVEGGKEPIAGTVSAIDPTVNPVTRSLKLRASAPAAGNRLRPGMFVQVAVVLPEKRKVVAIPATALVRASYGNSVFVVEPAPNGKAGKVARQKFVRSGEMRGDFIAIDTGLADGEEVVIAGAFKLRNGMPVAIDNSVAPASSLAPMPENR